MAKELVKIELNNVTMVQGFEIGDTKITSEDMKERADGSISNSVWVPTESLTTVGNEFIVNRVLEYPITLANGNTRMVTAVGVVLDKDAPVERLVSGTHFRSLAVPTLKKGQVIVVDGVDTRSVPVRKANGKIKKDPTTGDTMMEDKKYAKFVLKEAA